MDAPRIGDRERLLAVAINLSAIPAPYLGPLVGYLIAGNSAYARDHAIRLVLDELVLTLISATLIAISLGWTVLSLFRTGLDLSHIDWKFVFGKAIAFWLILQGLALANTIASIHAAIQASQGRLPKRLRGIKRLSARLSGLELPS